MLLLEEVPLLAVCGIAACFQLKVNFSGSLFQTGTVPRPHRDRTAQDWVPGALCHLSGELGSPSLDLADSNQISRVMERHVHVEADAVDLRPERVVNRGR